MRRYCNNSGVNYTDGMKRMQTCKVAHRLLRFAADSDGDGGRIGGDQRFRMDLDGRCLFVEAAQRCDARGVGAAL